MILFVAEQRLKEGDFVEPDEVALLIEMVGADPLKAEFVFTDPPYNARIRHVSGLGRTYHAEFAMASGEMSRAQYTKFLRTIFQRLTESSTDGFIHQICMDWRHMDEILEAGRATYAELKNLCVWNKTNAGMGSFYRSQHELVFVFKNGQRRTRTMLSLVDMDVGALTCGRTLG